MAVAFTRSEQPGTEEATLFYGNERDADTLSIKEDGVRSHGDRNHALFSWETRSLVRRRILQVVIGILGIAIIVVIILAFKLSVSDNEYTYLGNAMFKPGLKTIKFKNAANQFVLSAQIGLNLSSSLKELRTHSSSRSKYVTADGVTLILKQETQFSFAVNWTSSSKQPVVFKDCFVLSRNAHWYGGSEVLSQKWPIEKVQVSMAQYIPQSTRKLQNKAAQRFGSVLERYWLNSRGIAILADSSVPLHVSINENGDGKLCLKSDATGYLPPAVSYLGYRIISGYNPRDVHLMVVEKFLGHPNVIPNRELMEKPLWVLGNYSDNITKKDVQNLSEKISQHRYTCGNVVIGGHYGEKSNKHNYEPEWFTPSPEELLVNTLKSIRCNISMNVHPYLQVSSTGFSEAASKGYLLKDCGGKVPGLIRWRDSLAACIDVTRNSNLAWFRKQLVDFQMKFGFDSFQFSGGVASSLPSCYKFSNNSMDPGHFSYKYAKFAASMNGLNVHVGHRTQTLPIFVRMTDKDGTWDDLTGLKTLIPTVLTYGIMGYPYVLPSIVGGHHGNAEKELYIRWMQVNVFLPGVQFSKTPWDFDAETVSIVRDLLAIRASLNTVLMDAFNNVTKTGAPVVRPLWWVAPTDPVALKIDTQFMLGDTYLVAPILERNQTVKKVYLPVGRWHEQFDRGNVIDNKVEGRWKTYNVNLTSLLYFKCLELYS